MRLVIDKNRNGRAGRTIKLDTEYDFLTFYREPPPKDDNDDEGTPGEGGTDSSGTQGDSVPDEDGDVLILQ